MKYKLIVVAAILLLFISGCKNNDERGNGDNMNTTSTSITDVKIKVTAEEFMAYYSITEEQVPEDYVQSFIDEYNITSDQLGRGHMERILLDAYKNGEVFGYDVNSIFQGPGSKEAIADYMKQAEVVQFYFGMHYGSELAYGESMVIDLKEGKIYYTRENIDDYINYELSAELTATDVEGIRAELPTHIEENKGVGDYGMSGDYTFMIKMNATDGTTKYYDGNQGDEEHFPGFDGYWKSLYKKYFGEEYKFIKH
ncbi:MAG: hypothetical protein IJO70_11995 [Lachnospiraceae bacterium]|nr:hypothetical protein [Lachnospiraceae bacterium]